MPSLRGSLSDHGNLDGTGDRFTSFAMTAIIIFRKSLLHGVIEKLLYSPDHLERAATKSPTCPRQA